MAVHLKHVEVHEGNGVTAYGAVGTYDTAPGLSNKMDPLDRVFTLYSYLLLCTGTVYRYSTPLLFTSYCILVTLHCHFTPVLFPGALFLYSLLLQPKRFSQ